MAKLDVTISKDLQDTVRQHDGKGNGQHPLISEVYFDIDGRHYFNKFKVTVHKVDENSVSTGTKEVECLGSKSNIVHLVSRKPGGQVLSTRDIKAVTEVIEIYATVSREDILSAKAVNKPKSQKEQLEILRQAAEIAKAGNYTELIEKLQTA